MAAGNVETSSRVADLVLAAFGHALGQGTMNNLTLGNDAFTYYETLGGGQGACSDSDGPSAVHVAMSNTLNTPIEALELEFPLMAVEYALRRGSGGSGRHRGGDGVARELRALDEMRYSLITERRRHAPPGASGGGDGARGRNLLNGEELAPKASGTLQRRRLAQDRDPWRWRTWQLRGSRSVASGSWAGRWPPTSPAPGSRSWPGTAPAARAEELAAEHDGVAVAESPAAAAAAAGTVISMVPDTPEVESVLLGPEGAVEGLPDGGLAIDMSTIAPAASRSIGERLNERGIDFLDAPVTGSRTRAEDATLTIMAAGPQAAFERARPLFDALGELVVHVGPQGHGSMIKLINNTMAAANAAALAESIVLARAAGVDVEKALQVAASGSGDSAMLTLKSGPMVEHDLEPLFKLEHMLKDVRHLVSEAQALGVEPRMARTAERLYAEADARGLGGRDFAAVVEVAGR